jgi:hypothetical protein
MGLAWAATRTQRGDASAQKWAITVFFLALGFATLAAYIKIGIDHREHRRALHSVALQAPSGTVAPVK